jgi:hypothetical protein
MATPSAPKATTVVADDDDSNKVMVVDIGKKQRKKRINQLRKGRGRLFDRITDSVADMQSNGAIQKDAQIVVFVVRRKKKSRRKVLGW